MKFTKYLISLSSVQFSCSVVSISLLPHGLQNISPPCPSPTPGVYSNSCSSHQWCHPTISSSVVPFSSHLQFFPATGSFPMSQFFTSGCQNIGASASVLLMNIQDWLPLELTGLISSYSSSVTDILVFFIPLINNIGHVKLIGHRNCHGKAKLKNINYGQLHKWGL